MSLNGIQISWSDFKEAISNNGLSLKFIETSFRYYLLGFDKHFQVSCILDKDGSDDLVDFESNYKSNCNKKLTTEVITQYEKDDKDLKLARMSGNIENNIVRMELKVPDAGRYIAGGYCIIDSYDDHDYVEVYVEDKDRMIAWALALHMNPSATEPIPDAYIQGMGEIPGYGAFPIYPIVKSYTDLDVPEENRGWHFWPLALGNNLDPHGYTEVEPIGGYGAVPGRFWLVIIVKRPNKNFGLARIDLFWGEKI
jgi:hypothetical protein